jgi:hypothetical protein
MRVICAWCGLIIKHEDGTGGLDSHGICPPCADGFYPSPKSKVSKEKHRLQTCATGQGER